MADFENGLPPVDTDLTGKEVSDISVSIEESVSGNEKNIQAVNVEISQAEEAINQAIEAILFTTEQTSQIEASITSISFSTEPAGKNLVLFYL